MASHVDLPVTQSHLNATPCFEGSFYSIQYIKK